MEQQMKIQVQISCVGQSTNPKLAIPDRVLQLVLPPAKEALHVLEEHLGPLPRRQAPRLLVLAARRAAEKQLSS